MTRPDSERSTQVQRRLAVILFAAVLAGSSAVAQESALVIAGGTLIDGNGGEPLTDAVIVIEGNRIAGVATGVGGFDARRCGGD